MGRPSEIYTKTLSVRVPMDSYIEVLQKASSMEMSVSEYLITKIFDGNNNKKEDNEEVNSDKSTNKPADKADKWELIETFENKYDYKHEHIKNILGIKMGTSKVSKDGQHKIKSIRKGLNKVYKLK